MAEPKVKTYYLPTYAYRGIAGVSTALSDIVQNIMKQRKTTLYRSKEKAWEKAEGMLCDDDTSNVVTIEIREYGDNDDYITMTDGEGPCSMVCMHLWDFLKNWCEIV